MPDPKRAGDPPLLLLHAAGLGRGSWDAVVSRFPGSAHTLALDLPGHGEVPAFAFGHDVVQRLAEYVAGRMAALDLHRPHVVGHSLGGAIALELGRHVPVAAVTALCTIGFRTGTHARWCLAKALTMLRVAGALDARSRARLLDSATVRRVVMAGVSARPGALGADVVAADVTSMLAGDLWSLHRHAGRYAFRPGGAHTPTNLVWAGQDRVIAPGDSARARRLLPEARHFVIPGSGHFVLRDDPDGAAAVIHACHTRLLQQLRTPSSPLPGNCAER